MNRYLTDYQLEKLAQEPKPPKPPKSPYASIQPSATRAPKGGHNSAPADHQVRNVFRDNQSQKGGTYTGSISNVSHVDQLKPGTNQRTGRSFSDYHLESNKGVDYSEQVLRDQNKAYSREGTMWDKQNNREVEFMQQGSNWTVDGKPMQVTSPEFQRLKNQAVGYRRQASQNEFANPIQQSAQQAQARQNMFR